MSQRGPVRVPVQFVPTLARVLASLAIGFCFTTAEAAITLVQHAGKDAGTVTSSTLAFPSNNTAGNWLAVAIRAGRTGQVFAVTDSRGNTYRRALQFDETLDTVTLGLYYAENIGSGPNTVTVADTQTGGTLRFAIFEYAGVATSNSLDGTTVAEGATASASSGAVTTTSNGDLIVGVMTTSDEATYTAGSGFTMEERVPVAPGAKLAILDQQQATAGPVAATAMIAGGLPWTAAVAAFRAATTGPPGGADLTLSLTRTGPFTQGQIGATYTLNAINRGTGPTAGTVTVSDEMPSGLTATSFAGTGWGCTLSPLTCTRNDALPAGSSYPAMTLRVNVSASAPASVTNIATVAGGGETNTANDTVSDPTTIVGPGPPTSGEWSAVRSWPIVAVHAHLLPSGDVLAWTDYTTNAGAQIWRRATNTFTPKTYSPVSLFCAGHAYLADGRLLIAGGIVGLQDDLGPRESTIFDPVSETWSAGGLMATGRYYPTTTTLPDGRVLVSGGTTVCSTCVADNPEIYDPASNSWTTMAATAWQPFKYYPHHYVLPDGRILLAAEDDKAISTQVLDLNSQTWTTIDPRILDGHSSVMYLPGKIMKAGKATADAPGLPAVATTFVLDMNQPSPAWQATALMEFPRSYVNLTILPDGQVLATGGGTTTDKANFATAVYEAELWSPVSQAWTTMSRAQTPRLYHSTALLLPDATVLVAGGGRQNGRSQPDPKDQANAEIFSPPYLFRGTRPVISSAPAILQYGTAFSVVTPDAARIASVSLIALGSVTHSFNENQRFVPLTFQSTGGSLTVQPPPNRNIAPPGPYMLFLVDTNGVPSVAAMVRLPAPGVAGSPDLTLTKTHAGSFTQGQIGATYTLTAANGGTGPTAGTVTVSDALPSGLTAMSLAGTGWGCTLSPLRCTRSDVLPSGSSYPALTLRVDVSASAPASLLNVATVGGGGETNAANDTASDPTTIGTGGGSGAITLVQHAGRDAGATTSSSLTFASNNTAGNWLAVAIRAGRTGQVFTVTDTRGNIYRRAVQFDETLDTVTLGLYYAENIASGPNTVTVTDTQTGGTMRFAIFEYSGVATSNSLDGVAVIAEGVAASASSGPVTTTANGDLILGVMSTANEATYSAGSGFTIQERVPATPGTKLCVEDEQQATAGPIAATATVSGGLPWTAAVAAFRAASGG